MKKSWSIAVCCTAVFTLTAAEPALTIGLNEGPGNPVVANAGTQKIPGVTVNAEHVVWEPGRDDAQTIRFKATDTKLRGKCGGVVFANPGVADFTRPFTIMLWIRPSRELRREHTGELLSTAQSDRGPGIRLVMSWERIGLWSGDGKNMAEVNSNPAKNPLEREVWHHICASFDGKIAKIYINGALAAENPADKPFIPTAGDAAIHIGSYRRGYAYGFSGCISDVRIFNAALSDAPIVADAKGLE